MLIKVVNIHKEACDVLCMRPTIFGNPFHTNTREENIRLFHEYFYERLEADDNFKKSVHGILDTNATIIRLGCSCKPKSCHVDVIAGYLNELLFQIKLQNP